MSINVDESINHNQVILAGNYLESETRINPKIKEMIFKGFDDFDWVIKITNDGIFFNREIFKNKSPEEFAQKFIDILEKCYEVSFQKRNENGMD